MRGYGLRGRAKRLEGKPRDLGVLDADDPAGEVGRIGERVRDPEQRPHRAGQNTDPLEVELLDPGEHLVGDPHLEDSLLQVVRVDQEGRDKRLEVRDAERVEDPCADPGQIDLAGLHILDRYRLVRGIAGTPVVAELDSQRAAREPGHLVDERPELLGLPATDRAGHREDDGLARLGASSRTARLVRVRAAAGGKHEGKREGRQRDPGPPDDSCRRHVVPPFRRWRPTLRRCLAGHIGALPRLQH